MDVFSVGWGYFLAWFLLCKFRLLLQVILVMYGLKWKSDAFFRNVWKHVTPHRNNVIDFAETRIPQEIGYGDEIPEIPVFWVNGTSQRHGFELKTFRLYGPLSIRGGVQFGSVLCRITGNQDDEKDRATTSSWGFGRGLLAVQQQIQGMRDHREVENGSPEDEDGGSIDLVASMPLQGRAAATVQAQVGPDPMGIGIPGSLKVITYQTLTHTLKSSLAFNYSGVCSEIQGNFG
jgi:hypothetical protein